MIVRITTYTGPEGITGRVRARSGRILHVTDPADSHPDAQLAAVRWALARGHGVNLSTEPKQ